MSAETKSNTTRPAATLAALAEALTNALNYNEHLLKVGATLLQTIYDARQNVTKTELTLTERAEIKTKLNEGSPNLRISYTLLLARLADVASHDSPEAVSVIARIFSRPTVEHRIHALRALAGMTTPEAKKAMAKRLSWLSFSDPEEKMEAKRLLGK